MKAKKQRSFPTANSGDPSKTGEPASPDVHKEPASDSAGGCLNHGENDMNMMTTISIPSADVGRSRPKLFVDENGDPSDRAGPDLSLAEPIADVVGRLRHLRNAYAAEFIRACQMSGIDLTVIRGGEGRERISMGYPCDGQEQLRLARGTQLAEHLRMRPTHRRQVIQLLNMLGHFVDNLPYQSPIEATDEFRRFGGRIMLRPDGEIEHQLPYDESLIKEEGWSGYPAKRVIHRFMATLRQPGSRNAIAQLVADNGVLHIGSGWTVWEGEKMFEGHA